MEERNEADWRPNWTEVSDLMRPIEEGAAPAVPAAAAATMVEQKQPELEEAHQKTYGQALWDEKKDDEDRERRKLAKQMRRLWDNPDEQEEQNSQQNNLRVSRESWQKFLKLRTNFVMAFLRHYAPYALLLLLAPHVMEGIVFFDEGGEAMFRISYWVILFAPIIPLTLLSLWLRPIGDHPFFRFSALLLPIQLYFTLQYASRTGYLWLPFALLIACTLIVLLSHLLSLFMGARKPKKKPAPGGQLPNVMETAIAQKHEDDLNGGKSSMMKEHWRYVLCYSVPCMAALLLAFAVMGALPESPDTGLFTAISQEESRRSLMHLSQRYWAGLSSREKREAMQLLLNLEADHLEIGRLSLDDEAIFGLRSESRGAISIRRALRTGRAQAEARIRAVCYAAFYYSLTDNVEDHDAKAAAYAEGRVAHYMLQIETFLGEY